MPAAHRLSPHVHSPFGTDRFGRTAERFARFFGTPGFILGQTVLVVFWIILNAAAVRFRWDPYPFILLNLAFSTQAAYAAPLILLAQTRQADRDKETSDEAARIADAQRDHVEHQSHVLRELLEANTALTEQIVRLTAEIHETACGPSSNGLATAPAGRFEAPADGGAAEGGGRTVSARTSHS